MRRWKLMVVAAAVGAITPLAVAHPPMAVSALVKVDPNGHTLIVIHHDALAFALNDTSQNVADEPMFEFVDSSEEFQTRMFAEARDRFLNLSVLAADGERVDIEVLEFPSVESLRTWLQEHPDRRLPVKLDIVASAQLPAGARSLSLRFPDVLGDAIVTFDLPGVEPIAVPLREGETSPRMKIGLTSPTGAAPPSPAQPLGALAVAGRYTVLGFFHIVPEGIDHAMFVLSLFLLSPRFKTVLGQITAFTIAHSITLTLTTLHLLTIPPEVVEPIIAASIAVVAVENLFATKVHSWRLIVAFAFGLVHGMGFASALSEVGLPIGQLAAGLVAFSVGVELGHTLVLATAFLALSWWHDRPWYRRRIAVPVSLVIAAIALFWTVQRL